jgi:hypothetical protein
MIRHRDGITRWSVSDGRFSAGTVELADDGMFVARDRAGTEIGRFDSRLVASRALELVER